VQPLQARLSDFDRRLRPSAVDFGAFMPTLPCPNCQTPTRRAMDLSEQTYVNYYRCDACKHIWTTDKQTHALVRHVTPLTTPPNDEQSER
jgi:hypothetical protein